jgi:hypothetical protein
MEDYSDMASRLFSEYGDLECIPYTAIPSTFTGDDESLLQLGYAIVRLDAKSHPEKYPTKHSQTVAYQLYQADLFRERIQDAKVGVEPGQKRIQDENSVQNESIVPMPQSQPVVPPTQPALASEVEEVDEEAHIPQKLDSSKKRRRCIDSDDEEEKNACEALLALAPKQRSASVTLSGPSVHARCQQREGTAVLFKRKLDAFVKELGLMGWGRENIRECRDIMENYPFTDAMKTIMLGVNDSVLKQIKIPDQDSRDRMMHRRQWPAFLPLPVHFSDVQVYQSLKAQCEGFGKHCKQIYSTLEEQFILLYQENHDPLGSFYIYFTHKTNPDPACDETVLSFCIVVETLKEIGLVHFNRFFMFGDDDKSNQLRIGRKALQLCTEFLLPMMWIRKKDFIGYAIQMSIEDPRDYQKFLTALGFTPRKRHQGMLELLLR